MIFVFGSNLAGIHGAGAAKYANLNLGAEWGCGEGLTGACYALPTKDKNIKSLNQDELYDSCVTFVNLVKDKTKIVKWNLTPVGCGLAGFQRKTLIKIFKDIGLPDNVFLSASWINDWPEDEL